MNKQKIKKFSIYFKKTILILFILYFLTPPVSVIFGNSLKDIKKVAGTIKSIKAEFIQEKHMKILKRPLISKGNFLFKAPRSLRWEYVYPIKSILLISDKKSKRYIDNNGTMTEDSSMNLEAMRFVVQEITGWLSGNFEDNQLFNAKLEQGKKIILTPKNKSFSEMIEKIEITLSNQQGVIDSVIIYENLDSYTKIKFINSILN